MVTLREAAEVTLDRLGIRETDSFLVVYNPELELIAKALAHAACDRSWSARIVAFPPNERDGQEPPADIATAMAASSAIALVTRHSLSHTRARLEATGNGARIASLPGINEELFCRAFAIDYSTLEALGRSLSERLTSAERCRVTAPGGTDVEISLSRREGRSDDGNLRAPGAFGNLPAGEAFIAPVEHVGDGTIVFDGSLASFGLLDEPVVVSLKAGFADSIQGGTAATWLARTLDAGGTAGRVMAELGIGTNPNAIITGRMLEDEKVKGTIHIAFGTNTGIGGRNQSSVHIDGLVRNPSIELDDEVIMRDGKLLG